MAALGIRAIGLKRPILLLQRNLLGGQAPDLFGLLHEFEGEESHQ